MNLSDLETALYRLNKLHMVFTWFSYGFRTVSREKQPVYQPGNEYTLIYYQFREHQMSPVASLLNGSHGGHKYKRFLGI